MERICSTCELKQPLENFNFRNKQKGVRFLQCKACTRAVIRSHYSRNTAYYLSKSRKRNRILRTQVRQFLVEYLQQHPCVDCNEKDIIVLEFDHIRDKKRDISWFIHNGAPIKAVENEISKCVVRCANCHRRKTAQEAGNWYRLQS